MFSFRRLVLFAGVFFSHFCLDFSDAAAGVGGVKGRGIVDRDVVEARDREPRSQPHVCCGFCFCFLFLFLFVFASKGERGGVCVCVCRRKEG